MAEYTTSDTIPASLTIQTDLPTANRIILKWREVACMILEDKNTLLAAVAKLSAENQALQQELAASKQQLPVG